MLVPGAVVDEEKDAGGGEAVDEGVQEGLGLAVDPMQVFKDQEQRLHLAFAQQQPFQGVERSLTPLRRIEGLPTGVVDRNFQEGEQGVQGGAKGLVERKEFASNLFSDLPGVIAVRDLEVRLEEVDDRQVGSDLAVGHQAGYEHEPVVRPMGVGDLPDEAGLAHARLADQRDHLAVAGAGPLEAAADRVHLQVSPDEPCEAAHSGGLETRAGQPGTGQFEYFDRLAEALHRHRAEAPRPYEPFGQPERAHRDQDGAGYGHLLHPRGEMGALADGGVVHVEVRADGPDDDLTRVQTDADGDGQASGALDPFRIPLHRLLHPKRRIARAYRVVLVGEGRPEQRHNAVAHHLVHGALVAMDRLHHQLEDGIENLAGLLWVAVGQQLHRALEIGEEHRHLLALTLQVCLGGEDAFGEVLWSVALWRGESPTHRRCLGEGTPALATELLAWRVGRVAGGAQRGKPGATVPAELLVCRVLVLASGTAHPGPSFVGGPRLARAGQKSQCREAQACYGTGRGSDRSRLRSGPPTWQRRE